MPIKKKLQKISRKNNVIIHIYMLLKKGQTNSGSFKKGETRLMGNTFGFKKGEPAWNKDTKGVMIAHNKGKKLSEEGREKLRVPHKGSGIYKRTEQAKLNIKLSKLKNPVRYWLGKKRPPISEAHKQKLREYCIANPNRVVKNTSIELKIELELRRRKIDYQKQVSFCKIAVVDFYLPKYNIIIQADGCYWHNCPIHGKGEIKNCTEKVKRQDKVLIANGYIVSRFWEHEINKSVVDCLDTLALEKVVTPVVISQFSK